MKTRTFITLALCASVVYPATAAKHSGAVPVHILALNDFHGHIQADRTITVRGQKLPVGGAAWLTGIFRARRAAQPGTLLVDAGDMVGASPPVSSLFRDEPTVEFLNMAHFDVGTLGNHEFDRGIPEMRRLWGGGVSKSSRYYPRPFPGARFPMICANILDEKTGKTLFPPYLIKTVGAARVGFIGAVTGELAAVTSAASRKGVREIDPATAINQWARYLGSHGVHSIVVLLHEGGTQEPPTPEGTLTGAVLDVADKLDQDVDVVVSAHSHQYTNAFRGKLLITQARSYGSAFAAIDLTVDLASGDIVRKKATIVDAVHDGVKPANDVAAMVKSYEDAAAPRINKVVGELGADMPTDRGPNSLLGALIADAQRESVHADVAFMNPGGVRAGLTKGKVTWGQVFTCQPFNNQVTVLHMTGAQIKTALEQQWGAGSGGEARATVLYPSGLTYDFDESQPYGARVQNPTVGGAPLAETQVYAVAMNSFLAGGGDGFPEFATIKDRSLGPNDLDALISYLAAHPGVIPEAGRVHAASAPKTGG
ncbi:MAG TPA: bifunctional metallophosphatase/5'-nucleotidase [Armatimonadota bacterium]